MSPAADTSAQLLRACVQNHVFVLSTCMTPSLLLMPCSTGCTSHSAAYFQAGCHGCLHRKPYFQGGQGLCSTSSGCCWRAQPGNGCAATGERQQSRAICAMQQLLAPVDTSALLDVLRQSEQCCCTVRLLQDTLDKHVTWHIPAALGHTCTSLCNKQRFAAVTRAANLLCLQQQQNRLAAWPTASART